MDNVQLLDVLKRCGNLANAVAASGVYDDRLDRIIQLADEAIAAAERGR